MRKLTLRILTTLTPMLSSIAFMAMATPMLAHEFWLDPIDYQIAAGDDLKVHIRNGQNFNGVALPYFDSRVERFDWIQNGTSFAIESRAGNAPAVDMPAMDDGLMVLVYQSTPSTLIYSEWAKFSNFVTHKGFPEAIERHHTRALPDVDFKEVYTRFCKTLIGIGAAKGQDRNIGLEIEIVAHANPYVDDLLHGFPVQVFYQGQSRANAQIEIFERAPDNTVTVSIVIADIDGRANIKVKTGYEYLLDTVILREPSPEVAKQKRVVWESLWASMTFAVGN